MPHAPSSRSFFLDSLSPASVYLSRTVWADARSGARPLAAISQFVLLQLSAVPSRCHITTLDLSGELPSANEGFGPEGADQLAAVVVQCPELSCLDLAWNRLGDQGVGILGAWALSKCPELSHLCLKGNGLETAGSARLGEVLILLGEINEGTRISDLDLGYNRIGDEGARSLSRALVNCRMLSHLDLCHDAIGSEGMEILAGVLAQCTALSHLDLAHLDLSSNDIGTAGAESLGGVLPQCRALASLKLAWNWIGNEGAERLAEVLGQCPALVHLDLEFNEIEAEGAERLRASWLGEASSLVLAEEDEDEDEDEDTTQNGSDEEDTEDGQDGGQNGEE
jgi:hypothetical protein